LKQSARNHPGPGPRSTQPINRKGGRPSFDDTADEATRTLLRAATDDYGLSPALVAKAKSTAESIAALMQDDRVRAAHIAEALFYRPARA